jgi:DNA polymerase III subunit delta
MKLQPKAVAAFLRKPDAAIRAAVIFGPDAGLVRERAEALGRAISPDLTDPFRVAELSAGAVAADPARLSDEVAAIPFTGGRRLVRVRDADESLVPALTRLLDDPPPGDGFLLMEAGDLATRSKLRTLAEGADNAAALPCYVEDEQSLGDALAEMLRGHGLLLDHDGLAFLAGQLVGDRRVAKGEIEKLALYAGEQKRLTLEDVHACIGDSASLDPSVAAWAAADGDFRVLDRALGRLYGEGTQPVQILRGAQRHFQRLRTAATAIAGGKSPDAAVTALKPPVFYKDKTRFTNQARRWPVTALNHALVRLIDAEAEVKRTHTPVETVCARALFQLASMARR